MIQNSILSYRFTQICCSTHLHFKAGFAFVYAIGGTATCPKVSETLHGKRGGAVSVPGDFEIKVTIVYTTIEEKNMLVSPRAT